jgi:hypothetical protein
MTAKIISIETKRCHDCEKSLEKQSEQFIVNEKQVVCSSCWNTREKQASGDAK